MRVKLNKNKIKTKEVTQNYMIMKFKAILREKSYCY